MFGIYIYTCCAFYSISAVLRDNLLPVGQPPVLKLLSWRFWGLSPRRHDSPVRVKFGTAEGTKFHVGKRTFGGFRPKKTKNC